MLDKLIGKAIEVVVKNGTKIIIGGTVATFAATASVISYNVGKKKGHAQGEKDATKIFKEKFKGLYNSF